MQRGWMNTVRIRTTFPFKSKNCRKSSLQNTNDNAMIRLHIQRYVRVSFPPTIALECQRSHLYEETFNGRHIYDFKGTVHRFVGSVQEELVCRKLKKSSEWLEANGRHFPLRSGGSLSAVFGGLSALLYSKQNEGSPAGDPCFKASSIFVLYSKGSIYGHLPRVPSA